MASKVNVRFIVILGTALAVAMVGVVALAYFAVKKTGEQNIALGDEAAARGDWDKAVQMYANAVAKNDENVEWIQKWISAMEKTTPATPQLYREAYDNQYMLALRGLANADRSNPDSVGRILEERYRLSKLVGGGLPTWENMLATAEEQLRFFRGDDAGQKKLARYRGLARTEIIGLASDPRSEDIAQAVADLEGALAVEPNDTQAVMALWRLDMTKARVQQQRNELDLMRSELKVARERMERFVAAHPPAPAARLALLKLDLQDKLETAERGTTVAAALREMRPQVQQLVDSVLAERAELLEPALLEEVSQFASAALDSGANSADMMMTHALQGRPNDPQILAGWAMLDLSRGASDKALERLEKVVNLPDPPLSLAGRILHDFRGRAVAFQSTVIFGAWELSKDSAERTKYQQRLDQIREQLTRFVPEKDPQLLSVDARREYMAGNLDGTRRLLAEYNEKTGAEDAQAVHLLAEVLTAQSNFGAARKMYERALELQPRNARVMRQLAAIAANEQDFAAAVRYLKPAVEMDPSDTTLATALAELQEREAGASSKDPVIKILNEFRAMGTGATADLPAAIALLRTGLSAHPTDIRLHQALVDALLVNGDKPGAMEALKAALVVHPENARLQSWDRTLNDPDPVKSQLELIAQSDAPEQQKMLARAMVYARAGQAEQASAELDKAIAIAPEDRDVFEARFSRALGNKDNAQIDELCRIADEKNLDNARGAVFRARRDLNQLDPLPEDPNSPQMREKLNARIRQLESVANSLRATVAQDRLNFALWRMLGVVQTELGSMHSRSELLAAPGQQQYGKSTAGSYWLAGSESLAKAYEIRPTDTTTASMYLRSLIAIKAYDRGLEVARKLEPMAGTNPDFLNSLIELESVAPGGDRAKAITARQLIAQRKPDDLANLVALTQLLIIQERFDEAAESIAKIRAVNPKTAVAAEARLRAKKRDLDGAVAIYRDYLSSVPEAERKLNEYVSAAVFMTDIGRVDDAVAVLRDGASTQSAAVREIDRTMADMLFTSRRHEEAARVYGDLLRAGIADPNDAILKRAVEANIHLERFDAAEELIASAGTRTSGDPTFLVLQAQAAAGKKELDRARRLLDQAVTAAPENALVYMKRAEVTSLDPARTRDVEADLEQAIRLDPTNTAARRMLATLYFRTSRTELGVEEMRRALTSSPSDDQLRQDLIGVLLALGLVPEAMDVVEDSLKRFPGDTTWRVRAAQLFTRHQRWERAAAVVGELWERAPTLEVAENYAFVLTGGNNPDMNRAIQVLSTPALKIDETPRLLLARARVYAKANKPEQAMTDIVAAWAKTDPESQAQVGQFFLGLESALPTVKDQLVAVSRLERRARLTGWALLYASGIRLRVPEAAAQGESDLRNMTDVSGNPQLQLAVWRAIGGIEYQAQRYEEALTAFRRGLTFNPSDAELNNNVAYTLGVDLKRPTEALPFAERAASTAPSSAMILDTQGAIYQLLGKHKEAAPILEQALNYGTTPGERVPAGLHLATSKKALGDTAGARQLLSEVEKMLDTAPGLRSQYEEQLKELRRLLDSE